MSQSEFAILISPLKGASLRTLQDWEQGRRKPTGAAKALLRVAITHPEALRFEGGVNSVLSFLSRMDESTRRGG